MRTAHEQSMIFVADGARRNLVQAGTPEGRAVILAAGQDHFVVLGSVVVGTPLEMP